MLLSIPHKPVCLPNTKLTFRFRLFLPHDRRLRLLRPLKLRPSLRVLLLRARLVFEVLLARFLALVAAGHDFFLLLFLARARG